MTEGDMKKLNRAELLAMLISITQRCDKLEAELQDAYERLDGRDIEVSRAGTLAEAALKINKIFEAADQAGAQYLANLQRMYPGDGSVPPEVLMAASQDAGAAEKEVRAKCQAIEAETKRRCVEMVESAKRDSQAYWDEVYSRIKKYNDTVEAMKKALAEANK